MLVLVELTPSSRLYYIKFHNHPVNCVIYIYNRLLKEKVKNFYQMNTFVV
jgi:hypothetical protein